MKLFSPTKQASSMHVPRPASDHKPSTPSSRRPVLPLTPQKPVFNDSLATLKRSLQLCTEHQPEISGTCSVETMSANLLYGYSVPIAQERCELPVARRIGSEAVKSIQGG